ncbi:delta-like protein [Elysia marginata]|uniref:Delta-like protein n=1 Tax=Elysia marginata TaxID=1093978 RepID=A0AAV4HPZ5_9GAST|nr:delta-like protein [Elysia marginata]
MTGLRYRNFTNHQGALADGTCCDNPGLTVPDCPRDQCDTNFLPCATYAGSGSARCGAYFQTPTGTMVDVDSFVLKTKIGNTKDQKTHTRTLVVFRHPFSSKDTQFNILAREITGNWKSPMAHFSFVIDWMDTFFSRDLHWRKMVLTDAYSELGLDVVHQCVRYYFGPTCSVYCKPTYQYTCLNNGSKRCTKGWQGPDCDELVPHCTSGLCQNGGTCNNIHLGYFCMCRPPYSGKHCEATVALTATNPSSTAAATDPSTTTTSSSNLSPTVSSRGFLKALNMSNQTMSSVTTPSATSDLNISILSLSNQKSPTSIVPTTTSKREPPVFSVSNQKSPTSITPTITSNREPPVFTVANEKSPTSIIPTTISGRRLSVFNVSTIPMSATAPSTSSGPEPTKFIMLNQTVFTPTTAIPSSGRRKSMLDVWKQTFSTMTTTIGPFGSGLPMVDVSNRTLLLSTATTSRSGQETTEFNVSKQTIPTSITNHVCSDRNVSSIVVASASAGLILLVLLFALVTYLFCRMRKQKRRTKVQPALYPPLSHKENLLTKTRAF